MKYEIKFWREVKNGLLHLVLGAVVTHAFFPYVSLLLIIILLFALGCFREVWQYIRNKEQPLYIQIIDIVTIALGGVIWYWAIVYFNINVDLL